MVYGQTESYSTATGMGGVWRITISPLVGCEITAASTVTMPIGFAGPLGSMKNHSYAHLSPRGRRFAEENARLAAFLGMSIVEYEHEIGRKPKLPDPPPVEHRAERIVRLIPTARMDHRVHRLRVRSPGRWLAGRGRRPCGRRRPKVDLR